MEIGKKYSLIDGSKFRTKHLDADSAIHFHSDMCSGAWTANRHFTDEDNVTYAVVGNEQIAFLIPQDLWDCFGDYVEPEPTLASGWEPATAEDLKTIRDRKNEDTDLIEEQNRVTEIAKKCMNTSGSSIEGTFKADDGIHDQGYRELPPFTPVEEATDSITFISPFNVNKDNAVKAAIYDMMLKHMPKRFVLEAGGLTSWVHLNGSPEQVHKRLVKVYTLKQQLDIMDSLIKSTQDEFNSTLSELRSNCSGVA